MQLLVLAEREANSCGNGGGLPANDTHSTHNSADSAQTEEHQLCGKVSRDRTASDKNREFTRLNVAFAARKQYRSQSTNGRTGACIR